MRCSALAFGLGPGEPAMTQIVQILLASDLTWRSRCALIRTVQLNRRAAVGHTLLHVAEPDLGELARAAGQWQCPSAIYGSSTDELHALKLRLGAARQGASASEAEAAGVARKTRAARRELSGHRRSAAAAHADLFCRPQEDQQGGRSPAQARGAHGARGAALGQHRAAKFAHHPPADPTPHDGMQPGVRIRRHTRVPGSKIGSTFQATKIVQAFRDAKRQLAQSAGGELVPHSPTAMIFTRQPALEVHR